VTVNKLAALPDDPQLDGVNLIPHLSGQAKSPPHAELYWRWVGQAAIRQGNWKYLTGAGREYLFNLDADAEERQNLIKQRPELAAQLKNKLESWSQSLTPPGLDHTPTRATQRYFDWYLDGKR
jgi:uncharacterized sulfatase